MKKVIMYGGATIVALVLIVWKLNANKKHNEEQVAIVRESSSGAVPVTVVTVKPSSMEQEVTENGNFEAVNQIELTSEVAGRIRELYVKEGSRVEKGQIIARIDNDILEADYAAKQSQLTQAKLNLARYEEAVKTGGVTQKQVDDARLEVENAQSVFTQVTKNKNNAAVKSPVNGFINTRFVEVGSYLAVGNKIVEIVDGSRLKLIVNVNEYEAVHLHEGMRISVTASLYPEVTYEGTVTFIAEKGDASLNYPVEIEIRNIEGKKLKPGMYGTAHFKRTQDGSSVFIPRSSFQGGLNSNLIFLNDNGKAKLTKVIAGRVYGDRVEIREGVKEGDVVITSGQINLVDGTVINVIGQ